MDFNFDIFSQLYNEMDSASKDINSSFNCQWNDDVHESFYEFTKAFDNFVKNLQDVSSNISESLSSLSKVNYDDLKNEFDKLNSKTSDDKKGEGSK